MNVLVLGHYDRRSVGHEAYRDVFSQLLVHHTTTFAHPDDVVAIDTSVVDVVVVGGGDVLSAGFLDSVRRLVSPTTLPCYALSVGMPQPSRDAFYASMFDHIVPRSTADATIVAGIVGCHNVTRDIADVTLAMGSDIPSWKAELVDAAATTDRHELVVCLTGSAFEGNPDASRLIDDMINLVRRVLTERPALTCVRLVAFETESTHHSSISDVATHAEFARRLSMNSDVMPVNLDDEPHTPVAVLGIIARAGAVMTMRYHAGIFAMLARTPCFCLHSSTRLANFLQDHGQSCRTFAGVPLLVNPLTGQPCGVWDVAGAQKEVVLIAAVHALCATPSPSSIGSSIGTIKGVSSLNVWEGIIDSIMKTRRRKHVFAPPHGVPYASAAGSTDPSAVVARVLPWLSALLTTKPTTIKTINTINTTDIAIDIAWFSGTRHRGLDKDAALAAGRAICYGVTGDVASADTAGVQAHVLQEGWDLRRDVVALCGEVQMRRARDATGQQVATSPGVSDGQTLLALYEDEACGPTGPDISGVHRSGWAFAMTGLRTLAASSYMRGDTTTPSARDRPRLLLDGYVDRTFNVAPDVLAAVGVLPYTRPWIGFVHHTFSPANGGSSVACLLRQPLFLASLPTCRCLVVFSKAMAARLQIALKALTTTTVVPPVRVLIHPTETPAADSMFSIVKFMQNTDRKVIQIGAWLRHPYAVYDLPLPSKNWWNLSKAVLHGPLMDGCVRPPDFGRLMAAAVSGVYRRDAGHSRRGSDTRSAQQLGLASDWAGGELNIHAAAGAHEGEAPQRPWEMCRAWSHACHRVVDVQDDIDTDTEDAYLMSLPPFLRDFVDATTTRDKSVIVLPHMTDVEYDHLLAGNLVFLALHDASAVNTVIECIVRHTPVIVNRLPALEEILGKGYPGFYDTGDLHGAVNVMTAGVMNMTTHLAALDKTPFSIKTFVAGFHALLVEFA